ncbi:MAG: DUF3857 domain-containing protein [Pyrinomonadaceae bacterium]
MKIKVVLMSLILLALGAAAVAAQQPAKPLFTIERSISKYEVNGDGTFVVTQEVTRRLNSKEEVEASGQLRLDYSTSLQSLEVLEAYTTRPDGKRTPVPPFGIQTRLTPEAEAAPNFSDLMVKVVTFPDLKVGSAITYKTRTTQKKPVFEGHFSMAVMFVPLGVWKDAQVEVTAPLDYPLYAEATEMSGGRLPDSEGRAHWLWKTAVEKFVEAEVSATGVLDQSPRLVVSSFPDYHALGKAYWKVAGEKAKVTPAVKELAAEITKGITDQRAQARAIFEWVNQNIRYIYISFGHSAVVPHDVGSILSNRYGDCKDYVVILQALLAAQGIDSFPVIIRADLSYWMPKVAAVEAFNHAIIYIPSLDLYADATIPDAPFGVLPQSEIGKSAFLAGAQTGVVSIPAGKPEENQIITRVEMIARPDGGLKATSSSAFVGRIELLFRPLFADMSPGTTSSLITYILEARGYKGSGKVLSIANAHKSGDRFEVKAEVDLIDLMKLPGPGKTAIPAGLSLGDLSGLDKLVALPERKTTLLAGALSVDEEYSLSFPQGITIDAIPQNVEFENTAGSYRSSYKQEGNALRVKRALVIQKDLYTPQEYAALKELVTKSLNDAKAEVKYSPAGGYQPPPPTSSVKREAALIVGNDALSYELSAKGAKLSDKQAIILEKHLLAEPDDIRARVILISYYGEKYNPANFSAQMGHIKWLIENHPELDENLNSWLIVDEEDEGFELVKTLWLEQVEKRGSDPRVLKNAAEFFSHNDMEMAEKLLLRGRSLEPDNYEWAVSLAEFYLSDADDLKEEEKKKATARALEQYDKAIDLTKKQRSRHKDSSRASLLPRAARTALDAGEMAKARAYATELLLDFARDKEGYNYGEAMHYGNIILGRAALKEGNVEKARVHLLVAGQTPGSPSLDTFGPDWELAKELLAKGEKEIVIQYLRLCANFWDGKRERLNKWEATIRKGGTPDFDPYGK